ncbi:MAG: hypothetical protein MRZ50_00910 [Prevotella sp.]|nr:hypothetical protein [Prevotella sp.]
MKDFAGLLAVFMSLVIPITAIIAGCIISVGNKKREKEIRQLIIENDLDIERAKLLIEKPQKKDNNIYGFLRGGMMFIGLGLGLLADYLLGIETRNMYFWLILSVGIGIGMLASFFAEMKLSEKKQTK